MAPFTFDGNAFVKFVKTLKSALSTTSEELEHIVYAPSFDHTIQDPVENDIAIFSRIRVLIIKGNYMLMNQKPWSGIADICDERHVIGTRIHLISS